MGISKAMAIDTVINVGGIAVDSSSIANADCSLLILMINEGSAIAAGN